MLKCLTRDSANKLKAGIKAGEFDIAKMFDMPSEQRRSMFEKYVDADSATFLNTKFEQAMVSSRVDAMKDWAEKTFTGNNQKKLKDITEKIEDLRDKELLTGTEQDAVMEDLIREKLGFYLTAEETAPIIKMSDKLQELAKQESKFGTPTIEYLRQRKALMDYINSLNPSPQVKVLTSIIGRLTMLFSFKSPLTNIIGNTVNGLNESIVRRMANKQFSGLNDPMFAEYRKFALDTFKETGYDITRMHELAQDQKIAGEELTTSQGKGGIRKTGRVYEDIYKYLMGMPDVAFAAAHFTDVVSLGSIKLANQEGLTEEAEIKERAKEIASDAMRIDPKTDEGKTLREAAISGAEMGTYTDQNASSRAAKAFRKLLNTVTGSARLGDLNIPFAQVPATVVQRSLESSGVFALHDGFKLAKAYKDGNTAGIKKYSTLLVRAGWGMLASYILMSLIDPDDFIGEYADYNASERNLIESGKATYNSLKIGNNYISLDYISPFSAPLIGMLNAKKYGKNPADMITKYIIGATGFVTRIPGWEEVSTALDSSKEWLQKYKTKEIDWKKEGQNAALGSVDFVSTRVIPAIISDFAKAFDDYERQVDYSGPQSVFEKIQLKLPVMRTKLPQKLDMFGEPIKTQNPLASIFAGSRYKYGQENAVLNELNRLAGQSMVPSLGDIQYTSSRVKELEKQIGKDKFTEAIKFFGQSFYKEINKEIDKNSYKRLNDEEKKERINQVRSELIDDTLRKFKYKKPKD